MYMLEVIEFFFAGRFSWMLRMFPERSVTMSLISGLQYMNLRASCLSPMISPIISPSLGRAHMPPMDAGREVGLILFRACSERVELQSPSSSHALSRTLLDRSRAPCCHCGS